MGWGLLSHVARSDKRRQLDRGAVFRTPNQYPANYSWISLLEVAVFHKVTAQIQPMLGVRPSGKYRVWFLRASDHIFIN